MHAVQWNYLRHHRDCLGHDDVEAMGARRSALGAILLGPRFPLRLHRAALAGASGARRKWIVTELAANGVWLALLPGAIPCGALRYHVAAMAIGQCLTAPFFCARQMLLALLALLAGLHGHVSWVFDIRCDRTHHSRSGAQRAHVRYVLSPRASFVSDGPNATFADPRATAGPGGTGVEPATRVVTPRFADFPNARGKLNWTYVSRSVWLTTWDLAAVARRRSTPRLVMNGELQVSSLLSATRHSTSDHTHHDIVGRCVATIDLQTARVRPQSRARDHRGRQWRHRRVASGSRGIAAADRGTGSLRRGGARDVPRVRAGTGMQC